MTIDRRELPADVLARDGFCECGCGQQTAIATRTARAAGVYAGYPNRFVNGGHAGYAAWRAKGGSDVPEQVKSRTGLCECGCGERTPISTVTEPRKGRYRGYPSRWVNNGHRARAKDVPADVRARTGLCECGCGRQTSLAPQTIIGKGDYKGYPLRFCVGHFARGLVADIPNDVLARDGFCECGCGQPTAIATRTARAAGVYAGYPNRFVNGHGGRSTGRTRSNVAFAAGRYRKVYRPEHPNADANGNVMEHRLVMSEMLGRALRPKETVHHINGDRTDNRPENLQLRQGNHGPGVRMECRTCGSHDVGPVALSE